MQKVYSRRNWENSPSTNTPLGENNLNAMDYAIDEIDNRVVSLYGYQDRVAESEENAKTSENNAKQSELNAKQSELLAKEYKDKAFTYTPDGYEEMVDEVFGLDIKSSTKSPLLNTRNGGLRFNTIKGKSEQNGTPTPTNPVPVKNAFDCVEMMQGAYSSSTGAYATNDNIICNKSAIPCTSGDVVVVKTENNLNTIIFYYNESGYVSSTHLATSGVTIPSGVTKFNFRIENTTVDSVGKIELTINGKVVVSIKTTDGNGKESNAYIKLSDSLRGIGDAKDEIVRKNSVWGVLRRIVKLTCNGSEGWGIGNPTYRFALSGLTGVADLTVAPLCTHLKGVTTNKDADGTLWLQNLSGGLRLNVFVKDYNNNLSAFKSWLASNPITIEYASTTPTFEELDADSQIALNSLETFNGATSISFDSVVQPTFEVEYGESKVGAYTLKALNTSESNEIRYKELAVALLALES